MSLTPAQQQEFAVYEKQIGTIYLGHFFEKIVKRCIKEDRDEQNAPSKTSKLYIISEICEMFSVTPATVHNWKKRGWLIGNRLGKNRYFTREEVDRAMTLGGFESRH